MSDELEKRLLEIAARESYHPAGEHMHALRLGAEVAIAEATQEHDSLSQSVTTLADQLGCVTLLLREREKEVEQLRTRAAQLPTPTSKRLPTDEEADHLGRYLAWNVESMSWCLVNISMLTDYANIYQCWTHAN